VRDYWGVTRSESSARLVPHDAASDVGVYFAAEADHTYDFNNSPHDIAAIMSYINLTRAEANRFLGRTLPVMVLAMQ